jgi:positive regulator of sigma E activity
VPEGSKSEDDGQEIRKEGEITVDRTRESNCQTIKAKDGCDSTPVAEGRAWRHSQLWPE